MLQASQIRLLEWCKLHFVYLSVSLSLPVISLSPHFFIPFSISLTLSSHHASLSISLPLYLDPFIPFIHSISLFLIPLLPFTLYLLLLIPFFSFILSLSPTLSPSLSHSFLSPFCLSPSLSRTFSFPPLIFHSLSLFITLVAKHSSAAYSWNFPTL